MVAASIVIGICLSAACGLKVFVPPLVAGLAHKAGVLSLSEHTQWLGTWPAISALAIAGGGVTSGLVATIMAAI
ncbi:MAG: DUF4126 domain-containing protein, partial [Burkholderiaceae bacterium]